LLGLGIELNVWLQDLIVMTQRLDYQEVQKRLVDSKNHGRRKYQHFTNNFYLIKSALRYYSVKMEMSFTSSKVSENFPLPVSTAGSCLTVLEELEVVERRTDSSKKRYMPENVDLELLEEIQDVLIENHEIEEHH
jgi:hypothetical protein